jgi:hypothetical protein
MGRHAVVAFAAIALAACAPALKLEKLPPPASPANAGEVVVIRPSAFIGDDIAYYLNVNEQDVLELGAKEHTRLKLPAGEHRLAIRCFMPFAGGWKETAIPQRVLAGETVYLAVAPQYDCASLEALPEAEGRKLAARTVFRPIGQ